MEETPSILLVGKGVGFEKKKYLKTTFDQSVHELVVPEPTDNLQKGISLINEEWGTGKYDILVIGSRGGNFIQAMDSFKGTIVMISPVINKIPKDSYIIWLHGSKDFVPMVHFNSVIDRYHKELVELKVLDDGHSLKKILENDFLKGVILRAYEMSKKREDIISTLPKISEKKEEKKKKERKRGGLKLDLMSQIRARKMKD